MIVGFLLGAGAWFFADTLIHFILAKGVDPTRWGQFVRATVAGIGTLAFCIPALFYIRSTSWKAEVKAVAYTCIVLLGAGFSRLLDDETLSRWASLIEVAVFVGGFIYLLLTRKENKGD
jgi:hypothetical protein